MEKMKDKKPFFLIIMTQILIKPLSSNPAVLLYFGVMCERFFKTS